MLVLEEIATSNIQVIWTKNGLVEEKFWDLWITSINETHCLDLIRYAEVSTGSWLKWVTVDRSGKTINWEESFLVKMDQNNGQVEIILTVILMTKIQWSFWMKLLIKSVLGVNFGCWGAMCDSIEIDIQCERGRNRDMDHLCKIGPWSVIIIYNGLYF